jgi:hypothetical protein
MARPLPDQPVGPTRGPIAIAMGALLIGAWAAQQQSAWVGVAVACLVFVVGLTVSEYFKQRRRPPRTRLKRRVTRLRAGRLEWHRQTVDETQEIEGSKPSNPNEGSG